MSEQTRRIAGPVTKAERPALEDALRRLEDGRLGPATEADTPPPSTFPMTRAARVAHALARRAKRRATPDVMQMTDTTG